MISNSKDQQVVHSSCMKYADCKKKQKKNWGNKNFNKVQYSKKKNTIIKIMIVRVKFSRKKEEVQRSVSPKVCPPCRCNLSLRTSSCRVFTFPSGCAAAAVSQPSWCIGPWTPCWRSGSGDQWQHPLLLAHLSLRHKRWGQAPRWGS